MNGDGAPIRFSSYKLVPNDTRTSSDSFDGKRPRSCFLFFFCFPPLHENNNRQSKQTRSRCVDWEQRVCTVGQINNPQERCVPKWICASGESAASSSAASNLRKMLGNPLALIRSVVTIFGDWAVELCARNFKVYTSFEKKKSFGAKRNKWNAVVIHSDMASLSLSPSFFWNFKTIFLKDSSFFYFYTSLSDFLSYLSFKDRVPPGFNSDWFVIVQKRRKRKRNAGHLAVLRDDDQRPGFFFWAGASN